MGSSPSPGGARGGAQPGGTAGHHPRASCRHPCTLPTPPLSSFVLENTTKLSPGKGRDARCHVLSKTESRCNQKADAGLGSSLDLWKSCQYLNNLCTISLFYNLNEILCSFPLLHSRVTKGDKIPIELLHSEVSNTFIK